MRSTATSIGHCRQRGAGFPAEVRRRGPAMLNQQCWCWGCDIRRPEGNLLVQYGFSRERVPEGVLGSSTYRVCLPEARVVTMWGFGLWYGDGAQGGLYLPRVAWQPQLTTDIAPLWPVWQMTQLPPMAEPTTTAEWERATRLLAGAMAWIADYEQWVITIAGLEYRRHCLQTWRKRTLEAERFAPTWRRLAQRCSDYKPPSARQALSRTRPRTEPAPHDPLLADRQDGAHG